MHNYILLNIYLRLSENLIKTVGSIGERELGAKYNISFRQQ